MIHLPLKENPADRNTFFAVDGVPVTRETDPNLRHVLYLTPTEWDAWDSIVLHLDVIDGQQRVGILRDPEKLFEYWCKSELQKRITPNEFRRSIDRFIDAGILVQVPGTTYPARETYRFAHDPHTFRTVPITRRVPIDLDETNTQIRRVLAAAREQTEQLSISGVRELYAKQYTDQELTPSTLAEWILTGKMIAEETDTAPRRYVFGFFLFIQCDESDQPMALPSFAGFEPYRLIEESEIPMSAGRIFMTHRSDNAVEFTMLPILRCMVHETDNVHLFHEDGTSRDPMKDDESIRRLGDFELHERITMLQYFSDHCAEWQRIHQIESDRRKAIEQQRLAEIQRRSKLVERRQKLTEQAHEIELELSQLESELSVTDH